MFKGIKIKNLIEIENSCKSFAYSKNGENIRVLPPIVKKTGLTHHLYFFVTRLDNTKQMKAPILIIETNKNLDIKNVYNIPQLQAFKEYDLNKVYYSYDDNCEFFPNQSSEVNEKLRFALDLLSNTFVSGFLSDEGKKRYKSYIKKIKNLFPPKYYCFYSSLIKNDLSYIQQSTICKKQNLKEKNLKFIEYNKNSQQQQSLQKSSSLPVKMTYVENPSNFIKRLKVRLSEFVRKEIIPFFKDKGSYYKLAFYDLYGKYLREKLKDKTIFNNCLSSQLTNSQRFKNSTSLLNELKIGTIKTYAKACDSTNDTSLKVDTLCKILIVFLNSMLVEELKKQVFKSYEEEIEESIQIFNETISSVDNSKSKGFLIEIFNNLMSDYRQIEEDKFSDTYYAYLTIYKQ